MKTYNSYEYFRDVVAKKEPSLRYKGGDFDEWQKDARAKLSELLGLDLFEKCDDDKFLITETKDKGDYTQYDFEFQTEEGYFARASFLKPKALEGKAPCVICLQGHSTGMHISIGEPKFERDIRSIAGGRDFAVQAVREGYCAVALEQRYMGSAGSDEEGNPACITEFRMGTPTLLMGRCVLGERVWDIMRLIDVLGEHFKNHVDMKKIVCLGNSGGGTATFYASAIEERISLSVPSCSVCTYEASIIAMGHCDCNYVPSIKRYFNMGDVGCLIAPRKLIVVCGDEDGIFPLHGVKESFDIIEKVYADKDNVKLIVGRGGHQFYPDDAWPVIKDFLR